jgi:hypothetical protein
MSTCFSYTFTFDVHIRPDTVAAGTLPIMGAFFGPCHQHFIPYLHHRTRRAETEARVWVHHLLGMHVSSIDTRIDLLKVSTRVL